MTQSYSLAQPVQESSETSEPTHSQTFGSNADRIARLQANFSLIAQGSLQDARAQAHQIAQEGRAQGDQDVPNWAGWIWQTAQAFTDTQEARAEQEWSTVKSRAHHAAEKTRALNSVQVIDSNDAQSVESMAGGYWNEADQAQKQQEESSGTQQGAVGPYAVWTTGGGSVELPRDNWGAEDLRPHHSDRTNSGAAHRVRAGSTAVPYHSVDAYDLTFEKIDSQGKGIAGTAHGLPLMVPVRSLVVDIQKTFHGSGGYGKFILIEYLEGDLIGQRVEIHHLDTVEDFRIGQEISGGAVFGTQGASGSTRFGYATHVDIVGTAEAVVLFAKANQSGEFQTTTKPAQEPAQTETQAPSGTDTPTLDAVRAGRGVIKRGMKGESVKHIQKILRITADGDFGPITQNAVHTFQKNTGLIPPAGLEGVVGKTTLLHLEKPKAALDIGAPGAMGISPLAISGTDMAEQYTPQLIAFARAITYAEGTADGEGYFREVGNKNYGENQMNHPGAENVYRYMETGYNSDAYGRYQMLSSTWASWARQADVPTTKSGSNRYGEAYYNMAPQYQDKAMLEYLVRTGLQDDLIAGRVEQAVRKVNGTWSSLPGGSQRNSKTSQFYDIYQKMLQEEIQRPTTIS